MLMEQVIIGTNLKSRRINMSTGGYYNLNSDSIKDCLTKNEIGFEYVGDNASTLTVSDGNISTDKITIFDSGTGSELFYAGATYTPSYTYPNYGFELDKFYKYNLKEADVFLAQLYLNTVGLSPEMVSDITEKVRDSYVKLFKEMDVSIKIVVMPVRDQQTKLEIFPLKKKCVACHKVDE